MDEDPRFRGAKLHRMAGRIPQSFIDDLTARADIVELIGSRVELKKAGREYRRACGAAWRIEFEDPQHRTPAWMH